MENFRKERNFTTKSAQILSTYFSYGGMDEHITDPNNPRNDSKGTKEEKDIDFSFVAASYLSSYIINSSIWNDITYVEMAPKIIASFLKYVLARRVVPEYQEDLEKAFAIASLAKTETPACHRFNSKMPDDFNHACSILFCQGSSDHLPMNTNKMMKEVMGEISTAHVTLKSKRFRHARVVKKVESTREPGAEPAMTVEVVLEEMDIDNEKSDDLDQQEQKPKQEQEQWSIHISSETAALLQLRMVVWGTFFTLSNGVVFAQPLVSLPTFYVSHFEDEA
ncbi:Argonaute siRNA chaperone complex subunit Arb1-domain-containing protein [Lobosporangium transversale]|uniref:Argonaute siRNA chaperone complex subunit Arb1-domain-containing protein n=1 Tax=Lobosporangium transversale TaxID=64571 RepID=A0A1Y2GZK2_9FUNG|nr:Argonaute siRNA chaperone complex subunit Arb1-domain-containing protein [Lobosporangium transversale]ORZ27181.1 Argonaute siRNA chaperone complex subunit Arb1-domain-containing protein [Lobosporangium transversale]|eukprot:XP_021884908.1 Argonaute siRNA chaperone complex subunit Arb1-domain-containing protein [Lobosporangium transversale]